MHFHKHVEFQKTETEDIQMCILCYRSHSKSWIPRSQLCNTIESLTRPPLPVKYPHFLNSPTIVCYSAFLFKFDISSRDNPDEITRVIFMPLQQGHLIISGHSHGDSGPLIPMKAAYWRMKPKWLDTRVTLLAN